MNKKRAAFMVLLGILTIGTASAQTHVIQAPGFKPFAIVSSETGQKVSSDKVEEMMCVSTQDHLAAYMDLLHHFDILSTFGDSSGGGVVFAGEQDGRKVQVLLFTDHEDGNRLSYVWIDGKPALTCGL